MVFRRDFVARRDLRYTSRAGDLTCKNAKKRSPLGTQRFDATTPGSLLMIRANVFRRTIRKSVVLLLPILSLLLPADAWAHPTKVLGWLEGAYLQPWGVRVRARLDTGAKTSSIHAEKIEVFVQDEKKWARFHFPFGKKEGYETGFQIEVPVVRETKIKDFGRGASIPRYVIELRVCVSGHTEPVEFTLADRSNFNYPMILGRNALAGRYLVDSANSFLGKRSCPRKKAKKTKIPKNVEKTMNKNNINAVDEPRPVTQ